jgi:DNA-binding transcriptional ArsR family regulator
MESLTHTFSIKALLILLREGRRMTLEELSKEMGEQHGSITHAVDSVRAAGLVAAFVRRGAPYEEEVYLTPVGRTVADKLKEIEDLVGWKGQNGIS